MRAERFALGHAQVEIALGLCHVLESDLFARVEAIDRKLDAFHRDVNVVDDPKAGSPKSLGQNRSCGGLAQLRPRIDSRLRVDGDHLGDTGFVLSRRNDASDIGFAGRSTTRGHDGCGRQNEYLESRGLHGFFKVARNRLESEAGGK